MRDGWVEATLREALEPIANRPNGRNFPLVLSVTEKRGIVPQTEIFNHRIATDDISKYKVLEPMDIAYNPYLLWCGAIGQWQGTEAGVVSPVYECFRVRPNCEPRYLGYVFEAGILTRYFDALAVGSIVRRRRTIPSDFIAAPIQLPPLPEQKRIVDLMRSVDSYIESLGAQSLKATTTRNAVLNDLITKGEADWNSYKFKEIATATKGKLPRGKNEAGHGIPYLTANFLRTNKADFWIQNTDGAVMADSGDCLILWDGAGAGDLFSAQIGVVSSTMAVVKAKRPDITKEFLTLFLSSKSSYIKETCRGTTVPHVSTDAINNMDVFIPSISEQNRIVDLISSMDETFETLEVSHKAAKKLREGLLFDLLTGNHHIPSSYDKVLGEAQ